MSILILGVCLLHTFTFDMNILHMYTHDLYAIARKGIGKVKSSNQVNDISACEEMCQGLRVMARVRVCKKLFNRIFSGGAVRC